MSKKSVGKLAFFSFLTGFASAQTVTFLYAMGNPEFFAQKGTMGISLAVATAVMVTSAFLFKSNLDKVRKKLL